MGELSFLTIIVSLAVCSLLVYAVFQYMKVRLTILEQSHKEQALILQQFIEESSTDIHRLYQMKSSSSLSSHNNNNNNNTNNDGYNGGGYHGSIILEYANANANREYEEKPIAYNEPHMIHLDTALFQNKRVSNLIEISSDSEDTTDSESTTSDDSDDSAGSDSDDSASSAGDDTASDCDDCERIELNTAVIETHPEPAPAPAPAPEIKMITVDLGAIQDVSSSISDSNTAVNPPSSPDRPPIDVLAMLYKKTQQDDDDEIVFASLEMPHPPPPPATSNSSGVSAGNSATNHSITGLSVTELRFLLKEKYKQQPEKHAEIQKMKKVELIQALQAQ